MGTSSERIPKVGFGVGDVGVARQHYPACYYDKDKNGDFEARQQLRYYIVRRYAVTEVWLYAHVHNIYPSVWRKTVKKRHENDH